MWDPASGPAPNTFILSFSELAQQDDENKPLQQNQQQQQHGEIFSDYANADEAFFGQNIFSYVGDEVHGVLHISCCESRTCTSWYNPIYLVLYAVLYILTIPGALLHWALLPCIPVRKLEQPEVRELRSQGIYTAIGIAVISLPFAAIGLFLGDDIMVLINEVAIAVNCAIIVTNLIGLKVIADELFISTRTYAIGAWIIALFLIGLALVDAYAYLTFSWLTVLLYVFRLLEIFVYSVIAFQCIQLWDLYADKAGDSYKSDVIFTITLAVLFTGVMVGFVTAIVISEENAWRILYW